MSFMLVPSMFSGHSWLAWFLPGQFHPGGDNSGYLVFFSLLGLIDAVMIIALALGEVLPAIHLVWQGDLDTLRRCLPEPPQLSQDTRNGLIAQARQGLIDARAHIALGRIVLAAGALLLLLSFPYVTFSFAKALPQQSLFVQIQPEFSGRCICGPLAMPNSAIMLSDVELFTADQIAHAMLLGIPDAYGWHFSHYRGNRHDAVFTLFAFLFRLSVLLIFILLLLCLRLPDIRVRPGDDLALPAPEPSV